MIPTLLDCLEDEVGTSLPEYALIFAVVSLAGVSLAVRLSGGMNGIFHAIAHVLT